MSRILDQVQETYDEAQLQAQALQPEVELRSSVRARRLYLTKGPRRAIIALSTILGLGVGYGLVSTIDHHIRDEIAVLGTAPHNTQARDSLRQNSTVAETEVGLTSVVGGLAVGSAAAYGLQGRLARRPAQKNVERAKRTTS